MPRPIAIADACLPGSGLIVDGRYVAGIFVLVPAVIVLSALALSLAFGGMLAEWALPRALPAYVVLAGIALIIRWRYARLERIDPERVRALARAAAKAWLRGEQAEAVKIAHELVRAAPEMPNAWRALAMISGDRNAERRADSIEARG